MVSPGRIQSNLETVRGERTVYDDIGTESKDSKMFIPMFDPYNKLGENQHGDAI